MTKFKKPFGTSDLKMDFDTESYINHRIDAQHPLVLSVVLNLPAQKDVSEEWRQACNAQMRWEQEGHQGTYNEQEYEAASRLEWERRKSHYVQEGKKAQATLAPIIEGLGGTILSDHRLDPVDGTPWYGEMKIQLDSVEAVRNLATNSLVKEVTSNSARASSRRLEELAALIGSNRPAFRSRFQTADLNLA